MTEPSSSALDLLHPVVMHHVVNTLGWRRLRPLQEVALAPIAAGEDVLLVAPTAGGKTEAAVFPLLSRMADHGWRELSVLYIAPLKALLNNLLPRMETYAGWTGRRAAIWHGDVTASRRRQILRDRPDILLATPESLDAMLVSVNVDHRDAFAGLRAVVIDEVHAFAGDDRGWHLLAVLERLTRIAGRPLQRVGLSATVGNPAELLRWLQGSGAGSRLGRVVAPPAAAPAPAPAGIAPAANAADVKVDPAADVGVNPDADVRLDYVGSVANAAKVIASLHRGEKRLVFADSKRIVEELGQALRGNGVTAFLSHASLSAEQRRRSEDAFAAARDCVIVATSTLELGVDVGDLDRVIQIDSPPTVASFAQRLGRSGRRDGVAGNCLLLALDDGALLSAAGLLLLWARGWVERVVPPPEPRHIVAQQILALCLQEHRVGDRLWPHAWNGLAPFDATAEVIVRHLVERGFLDSDGGMLFVGPEAEQRFGFRHFMDLTSVFASPPQFTVLYGRSEIGRTDPALLTDRVEGPRRLLLAGRSWQVTSIDWSRRLSYVEPVDDGGRARWVVPSVGGDSYELTDAAREVLLGADPPVRLTGRAAAALGRVREEMADTVHPDATVIVRGHGDVRWWTWAGYRANATLTATLAGIADPLQRADDAAVRLRGDLTPAMWREATADATERLCLPDVDARAVAGLKFSAALPERLATATLAARLADPGNAEATLRKAVRFAG